MASNRPPLWLALTAATALLGVIHFAATPRRPPTRLPVRAADDAPLCSWAKHPARPLLLLGIAICGWAAAQALPLPGGAVSRAPGLTSLGALRLAGYALFFVLALESGGASGRCSGARLLVVGTAAHAAWALVALRLLGDVAPWGEKHAYLGFATGTFVNRNAFANFLGMGLLLGLLPLLEAAYEPRRGATRRGAPPRDWTGILCLSVIAVALVMTGSRMGVLSTTAGAVVASVTLQARLTGRPGRAALQAGSLALIALAALLGLYGDELIARGIMLLGPGDARLVLWRQTLATIAERPILGHGLDSFPLVFRAFQRPGLAVSLVWEHPHSAFLCAWTELGILVGSLPALAGLLALRGMLSLRGAAGRKAPPLAAAGVLIQGGLHSLVDAPLATPANALMFLLILALGFSGRAPRPPATPPSEARP